MMTKLKKLKTVSFLFVTNLIIIGFAKAAAAGVVTGGSVDVKSINNQDNALMAQSGLAANSSLSNIISVLIQTVLGFLGIVFLVLTIMAGFKWMTSAGNEKEIETAKSSLKNSIIGLLIVIAAYAITYSVFKYLPFSGGNGGVNVG